MVNLLSSFTHTRDNNFNLIRFVSAFLVLYSHSCLLTTGVFTEDPLKKWIGMSLATVGVDIFFVISGFLVARSFFSKNSLKAFVLARVLRIYPALIVAVFFCIFGVGLYFTTNTVSEYFSNPHIYKSFLKNITLFVGVNHYLPGVFAENPWIGKVNGSLWTLPHEVRSYALLAIVSSVLIYFQKWQGKNIFKAVFLIIAIIIFTANIADLFQILNSDLSLRLYSLFFTGVGFYAWRNRIYLSSKLFLLFLTILLLSTMQLKIFFILYYILMPYLLLYLAYVPAGNIRRFNHVGDYSYGIYIYAYPVQQSIVAINPNVPLNTMIFVSFSITFVLAFLSWHIIEKKFLAMKNSNVEIVQKSPVTASD